MHTWKTATQCHALQVYIKFRWQNFNNLFATADLQDINAANVSLMCMRVVDMHVSIFSYHIISYHIRIEHPIISRHVHAMFIIEESQLWE